MPDKFIVTKDFNNIRLDRWFKQEVLNLPNSLIQRLLRKNKIKVNNKKIKSSFRLSTGDKVLIYNLSDYKPTNTKKKIQYLPTYKESNKFENLILFDNEDYVVINKPRGLAVQSGTKNLKNVIDILKKTKTFEHSKPYIVHRLDKETSGVLIVAKNREYAQLLTSLFRIRKIHKTYLAISYGEVSNKYKVLEDNLITYEKDRKIIQKAVSHIKVLKSSNNYSLLELKPITGRKHQIRKQLYNIGNPVVGDDKYFIKKNFPSNKSQGLMLHAHKIKFMINGIKYNFETEINKNFKDFLNKKKLNFF